MTAHHVYTSAAWLLLARVCGLLGSAFSAVFVARWLGPSEYGVFALVAALTAVLAIVADLGLAPSTARFVSCTADSNEELAVVLRCGFSMKALLLVVTAAALWFALPFISACFATPRLAELAAWVVMLLVIVESAKTLEKVFEGLGRMNLFARAQAVQGIAGPVVAIVLVARGWGVRGAIAGLAVGTGLQVLLAAWFLARLLHGRGMARLLWRPAQSERVRQGHWAREIVRYSAPMVLVSAGAYIYRRSDFLMIQYFLDSSQLGFYNVQFRLIALMEIPVMILSSVVIPAYFGGREDAPGDRSALFLQCLRFVLFLYVPLAVLLAVLARPGVEIVFGPDYLPAATTLRIFAIAFLPALALLLPVAQILHYRGLSSFRARVVAVSALANVLLNALLIPRYGIVGAAIATQVTYLPTVAVCLRRAGIELNVEWRRFGGVVWRVTAAAALMLVAMLWTGHYAQSLLPRLILVSAAGVIVYLAASRILNVLTPDDVAVLKGFSRLMPRRRSGRGDRA